MDEILLNVTIGLATGITSGMAVFFITKTMRKRRLFAKREKWHVLRDDGTIFG